MDSHYNLGIGELDAQHEEIENILVTLQAAIENKDRWHVLHYILESLHDRLMFHFSCEEAVMQIFAYPETEEHRRSHLEALKSVENYKNRHLTSSDIESFGKPPVELFYEQIITHDKKFAAYIKELKDRLGLH